MSDQIQEQLTAEELGLLKEHVSGAAPSQSEQHNVHKFLQNVVDADDTTKLGNLTKEEVGLPHLPTRSLKELALISDKIMGNEVFKDYFESESEIITSTSLSKDAKLLDLSVITKRLMGDITKQPPKENKSWFKKKGSSSSEQQTTN